MKHKSLLGTTTLAENLIAHVMLLKGLFLVRLKIQPENESPEKKKETEIRIIKWHAIGGERFRSVRIA